MVNACLPIKGNLPKVFPAKDHPLKPLDDCKSPIETNKFYANLLLDQRTLPAFVHPYSVWWSKTENLLGLAVSHTTEDQRVFGQDPEANPCQYYFNPAGIQSINFGAQQWTNEQAMGSLSCSYFGAMSVTTKIGSSNDYIKFYLCSGMGFVTAIYNGNLIPQVQSLVGFQQVEKCNDVRQGVQKYKLKLFNQVTWMMYVSNADGLVFQLADNNHLLARGSRKPGTNSPIVIQCGSCPEGSENVLDNAAGCYPVAVTISAEVSGAKGDYTFTYTTAGSSNSGTTLVMALPHQVESFKSDTKSSATNMKLDSTTMGKMTGCLSNSLQMQETDLPVDIQFLPWTNLKDCSNNKNVASLSSETKEKLKQVAKSELDQDMVGQCCLDSMYFSGKGFDKYAFILIVTWYILKDEELTKYGLKKLQDALQTFIENKQLNPLVYDKSWKGLISSAGYNDPNADFGNTYYNDHHFHYGYFFHAAAVIAAIDKEFNGNWLETNKDWVNALVRDVCNPSLEDEYFPEWRSFDWYVGHSWAKGLFLSGDGKDEESSSEDYHFAYGVKLWGKVSGDESMEARGNLMLAVMKRAMNKYMLYSDDNKEQPSKFIRNKVSGITFENKIDHATYFGLNPEYIHGIHMIPVTPISSYIRSPGYCKEEWDQIVGNIAGSIDSGWKGILKLNQALFDPKSSFQFFHDQNFKSQHLDPGMSLTWSMAYTACVV